MADRKVFVEVKVRLVIRADEGVEISEVLSELQVTTTHDGADIEDSEVLAFEVTDSK